MGLHKDTSKGLFDMSTYRCILLRAKSKHGDRIIITERFQPRSCLKYKPHANNRPHYSPKRIAHGGLSEIMFPESVLWTSAPASIHTFPSLPIQAPLSNGKPLIVAPVLKHWWQLKGIMLRLCLRRLIAIQHPAGPSEPGVTNTSLLLTNSLINANFLVDGRAVIPLTNYALVMGARRGSDPPSPWALLPSALAVARGGVDASMPIHVSH